MNRDDLERVLREAGDSAPWLREKVDAPALALAESVLGEFFDNPTPQMAGRALECLDALGLTPAGRKKLRVEEPDDDALSGVLSLVEAKSRRALPE